MLTRKLLGVVCVLLAIMLTGCESTPKNKKQTTNQDADLAQLRFLPPDALRSSSHIENQLMLANRGLYLNQFSDINYISNRSCLNLKLHSHLTCAVSNLNLFARKLWPRTNRICKT